MKIYYWSPFFTNIATIKAVIKSAESLVKFSKEKKYDVSLVDAIGEWDPYVKIINKKIKIIKLNKIKLVKYLPKNSFIKSRFTYIIIFLWDFFKLKNLINKQRPNFLIIHLMTSLPIFLSLFFNKETKIILRISGLPKINFFRYFFWKIFSNKIYKVTCPTNSTYNYILERNLFRKEKLEILSDPIIDMTEYRIKKREIFDYQKLKNKKYLIAIGRLTKQKNFELLISFFKKISDLYPNLNLAIIGEGEKESELKRLSNKFKINQKVYFLGYQDNVFKYLLNAECFVLTSLWEDPGFVLVEAALANLPIISSKCPNGPEEIVGDNGYLFKNNDLNDLSIKFKDFLNTNKQEIYKNKVIIKKRIKKFTLLQHFRKLDQIIN
jgi:glycosyltransferase involved in cell wall biosynthesis